MFEFLAYLLAYAFGLAVLSAGGLVVVHKLFPQELPPRIQILADLFLAILNASAKVILGPFELLKRIKVSLGDDAPSVQVPHSEVKKITDQQDLRTTLLS